MDAIADQVFELEVRVETVENQQLAESSRAESRLDRLEEDMGDLGASIDQLERRHDRSEQESAALKAKLEELTKKLKDRGAPTTEFFAILQPAYQAWSRADDECKRSFIINGIRSSFFQDKFRPLRRHLFHILDQIEPFMFDYLAAFANRGKPPTYRELGVSNLKNYRPTHATEGRYYRVGSTITLPRYAVEKLAVLGLVFNNSGKCTPTELGLLTLDFIGVK